MKNKAHFILVLLVLGMIVPPVMGWGTVWTKTFATNGACNSYTGGCNYKSNIYPVNMSDMIGVTKFVQTGTGFNHGATTSGSRNSIFHMAWGADTAHTCGNATYSWTAGTSGVPSQAWSMTITMDTPINSSCTGGHTGSGGYFYEEGQPGNNPDLFPLGSSTAEGTSFGAVSWVYNPNQRFQGDVTVYNGSSVVAPVASFTCSPTSQFPDEDVICTDTSSNTPTDWLWTLDYEALGIKGWQTSTSRNFTWQSHYTGIFGVNLWANNSAGGSWYNRSNYVEISDNATPIGIDDPIPEGYIRSMVQCVNPEDSSLISDCAISIKDIEGNAWSNGSFHGTWFIDTLPLHHINAYGSASGYTSAYRLNLDASSSLMYELFLFPGYLPPAADGHVRLYAIVNDYTTGAPVLNAQVEFKGSGESTQIKYTSVSGIAQVEWANVSTVYVSASKAGYSPASRTIVTTATGPDTVRLELSAPWVTLPVTSGTPLPGELTVRPTQDPNKNPDGSYKTGYSNIKGQEMMNWLAENGFTLVQLCFFVTILGLLGVKLGGK